MIVLGLVGKAGAGKDFTYSRLAERFGDHVVQRYSFGDLLKRDIEATLGADAWVKFDNDEYRPAPLHWTRFPVLHRKPYAPEIRSLLQWWGTELRRGQNPDYWVDKMRDDLADLELATAVYGQNEVAVITDLRYENEAQMVRDLGGKVVKVYALEPIRRRRLGGVLPPDHASESELEDIAYDFLIVGHSHKDWNVSAVELVDYLASELG